MEKNKCSKANNIYTCCRLEAAKYDDRLSSRLGASEELGCSVSALSDYELGIRTPQPYMILRMIDRYHAPELMYHYCSNECVLGKGRIVLPEFNDFDRITIKLVNALKSAEDISDVLLDIAEDGKITAGENRKVDMIAKAIENINRAAMSLQLYVAKNAVKQSIDLKTGK